MKCWKHCQLPLKSQRFFADKPIDREKLYVPDLSIKGAWNKFPLQVIYVDLHVNEPGSVKEGLNASAKKVSTWAETFFLLVNFSAYQRIIPPRNSSGSLTAFPQTIVACERGMRRVTMTIIDPLKDIARAGDWSSDIMFSSHARYRQSYMGWTLLFNSVVKSQNTKQDTMLLVSKLVFCWWPMRF